MHIELETLQLVRYSEEKYKNLKDELEKGISYSKYIHQIGERLEYSRNDNKNIFNTSFVVLDKEISVGYLFISSMINDEVFLEYAVLKEFRGMGYGSSIVNDVTNYLFHNFNIRSIRLDIDPSNKNSLLVANSCGFILDEEDYENRNFIGKMQFIKENYNYISKRKK